MLPSAVDVRIRSCVSLSLSQSLFRPSARKSGAAPRSSAGAQERRPCRVVPQRIDQPSRGGSPNKQGAAAGSSLTGHRQRGGGSFGRKLVEIGRKSVDSGPGLDCVGRSCTICGRTLATLGAEIVPDLVDSGPHLDGVGCTSPRVAPVLKVSCWLILCHSWTVSIAPDLVEIWPNSDEVGPSLVDLGPDLDVGGRGRPKFGRIEREIDRLGLRSVQFRPNSARTWPNLSEFNLGSQFVEITLELVEFAGNRLRTIQHWSKLPELGRSHRRIGRCSSKLVKIACKLTKSPKVGRNPRIEQVLRKSIQNMGPG